MLPSLCYMNYVRHYACGQTLVATGLAKIFVMLSLLKYLQKTTIVESSKAEQSPANK